MKSSTPIGRGDGLKRSPCSYGHIDSLDPKRPYAYVKNYCRYSSSRIRDTQIIILSRSAHKCRNMESLKGVGMCINKIVQKYACVGTYSLKEITVRWREGVRKKKALKVIIFFSVTVDGNYVFGYTCIFRRTRERHLLAPFPRPRYDSPPNRAQRKHECSPFLT